MWIFLSSVLFSITENEADELFYNGEYTKALKCYLEVVKKKETPEILFNIGICYEKLKNYEKALFYFKKAQIMGWKPALIKVKELERKVFKKNKKIEKDTTTTNIKKEVEKRQPSFKKERIKIENPTYIKSHSKNVTTFWMWGYVSIFIGILGILYGVLRTIMVRRAWNILFNLIKTSEKGFVGMKKKNMFGVFFYSKGKIDRALVEVNKNGEGNYFEDEKALIKFFGKRDYKRYIKKEKSEWRELADSFITLFKR